MVFEEIGRIIDRYDVLRRAYESEKIDQITLSLSCSLLILDARKLNFTALEAIATNDSEFVEPFYNMLQNVIDNISTLRKKIDNMSLVGQYTRQLNSVRLSEALTNEEKVEFFTRTMNFIKRDMAQVLRDSKLTNKQVPIEEKAKVLEEYKDLNDLLLKTEKTVAEL